MKTMCPSGYHHNSFVATHALGHMMYGLTPAHEINICLVTIIFYVFSGCKCLT